MPINGSQTVDDYINAWANLPSVMMDILKRAFILLAYSAVFIGSIMVVWGAIEWATGYNELGGRKNIIRGVVLIILALAPMLVSTV